MTTKPKLKGKSTCCQAQGEWAYSDRRLRSDLAFVICAKCKQGSYSNIKDIEVIYK